MRKPAYLLGAGLAWLFLLTPMASAQVNDQSLPQRLDSNIVEAKPDVAVSKNVVGDQVTLRTLDKVTAITKDFSVKVGDSLKFGTLTIDVKHCEVKPPQAIPETFAFLQIFEPPKLKAKERAKLTEEPEPNKLFSGWMLASKPAISALDHSVYDVWVIGCQGGNIQ